jgi:hypothetical protein
VQHYCNGQSREREKGDPVTTLRYSFLSTVMKEDCEYLALKADAKKRRHRSQASQVP